MRRRLILVFVAVSTLVSFAFVLPLGFLVRRTAEDRAIDVARADAASVVPALATDATAEGIEAAVGATTAGRLGRMTVLTSDGWTIGPGIEASPLIDAALAGGTSDIGAVDGGVEVVAAVASGPDELSAIRVFVPDDDLRRGQWRAWLILAAVGATLVGISVVVADRLARTVVRPTQDLATAARRLGDGELDTEVSFEGPGELMALADVFNGLGRQVASMLDRERELVAELSHRLRTPLTKLRLRLDEVEDDELAAALRADVDDLTAVVDDVIGEARGALRDPAECDAVDVVAERAEFWRVLADDQYRQWRFERPAGIVKVPVARRDLVAAVDVLLENVFSHTPDGTAIAVGFEAGGGMARIWVADAGDGFEPSAVARGASSVGSTGLGLDIARRLADQAGGRLDVGRSELGGAEVSLVLPVVSVLKSGPGR